MRALIFYLLVLLVLVLLLPGCERKAVEQPVPADGIAVTIFLDADTACPRDTACTRFSVREDGTVDYTRPITIHLAAGEPLRCVAHEVRHVLEGEWHQGRVVPCDRY